MTIDHARAESLLERFAAARAAFDGDAWVDLFASDVVWQASPFGPTLRGPIELRRMLLEASEREEQVELTFERHWVVPPTILAPWHSSHVQRGDRSRVRIAGFATFEIDGDGRIRVARMWAVRGPSQE